MPAARKPTPAPQSRVAALQAQVGASGMQAMLAQRTQPPSSAPGGDRRAAGTGPPAAATALGSGARADRRAGGGGAKTAGGDATAKDAAGKAAAVDREAAKAVEPEAKPAATAVQLHMPEPPSQPSKATRARIAGVASRAGGAVKGQATLPDAGKQVDDALKAVTSPEAERIAQARAQLIAMVPSAPSPEIVKLGERIREVIRNKRPPDEDALVKAEPAKEASEAGAQLSSTVQGESRKVQDTYGSMEGPAQPAAAAPGAPLPPQPAAAQTPAVNAKAAVPDAVPAENVSLDKDAAATRKQADDAGMNKPAAALVGTGPIAEARAAQGELDQAARENPAEILAKQKEALGKADADMGSLQMQALQALTASRAGAVAKTTNRQRGMVGTDEEMRATAGADAKAVFDQAQTDVRALLKPLVPTAMDKWEAARTALTTQFKNDLRIVKERVDERHSGVGGWFVGVWDVVTGLPGWATEAYDKAENNFAEGVIAKLTEISIEVNSVIQACEAIIKTARERIAGIFWALPESLRGWAAQEQAKFEAGLDKLGQEAVAARDGFNKDVTERASQAVDEVRAEIAELRKKAGGLVGRIVNAVQRFLDDPVKFIIEGLLELLGISPAAFWAVVAKIKRVVRNIVDDPVGFANNLLKGIGQGFSQFFGNFAGHMIRGFLSWLLGDLKDVQIPKEISVKSIITFFLQLMGITWPNIRKILAKKIGEKNVALIEKVYSLITFLIDQGPQGIYEMIQEKLDPQSIVDQVVQMAVEYMVTAIAKQVAARLLLLFNPAGAILQAIEAIYRVLKWVFQNAARIFTLIETIVNGLADIIAGNVGGFAKAVERGLAMLIAPVLGFIADYFSLGDLPQTVAKQIKSFREWILAKIEAGFDWLIAKGKALLAALGIGKKEGEPTDVKGEAEGRLLQTLGNAATPEETQTAVSAVFKDLQSKGLKALEFRQVDDGYEVDAEASPRSKLFKLLQKRRYATRFAARLYLEGVAPAHAGTTERTAFWKQTVVTGRGNKKKKDAFEVAMINKPVFEEQYTGRLVLDPGTESLDERSEVTPSSELKPIAFVTGNTGDAKHRSNSSHAEEQFAAWARSQTFDWRERVKAVEISITLSPCGKRHQSCINSLVELMTVHFPNVDKQASTLHWDNPWVDPGGETTTTSEDVENLSKVFLGGVGGEIATPDEKEKLPIKQ